MRPLASACLGWAGLAWARLGLAGLALACLGASPAWGMDINFTWGPPPARGGEVGPTQVKVLMQEGGRFALTPKLDLLVTAGLSRGFVLPESLLVHEPEDSQYLLLHLAPQATAPGAVPPGPWAWKNQVRVYAHGKPVALEEALVCALQSDKHPNLPPTISSLPLGREGVQLVFEVPLKARDFVVDLRAGQPPRWARMRFWPQTEPWFWQRKPLQPPPWPG